MSTIYEDRKLIAPQEYPDNKEFWAAARESRLMLKYCNACHRPHWYPRTICPLCGSDDTAWKASPGRGTIYSVTVTRRGGAAPFALAYVTLDEGVTMMSNIVDCDLDDVRIGERVELVFKPTEGDTPVPMFRPVTN